jgi:hypothetical protein
MLCPDISDFIPKMQCGECLGVERTMNEYERDENRMRITELFLNASAKCCAPSSPILLLLRCSVVSVCV